MGLEELGEENAPPNMLIAFKQLRSLYGEPLIPLKIGTSEHGASTDMTHIEVGLDQMMLTILPNHHEIPKKYQDSAAFFVIGHEFGHITSHPGKEAKYWRDGMRELPVEHFQRQRWFNAISDIIVNWTVISGTNIVIDAQKALVQPQMLAGWQASQFVRSCGNISAHEKLLKEGKVEDNRYCPVGGVRGEYDNADPADKFKPTFETPYWQRCQGHGRGEQYYPPISWGVGDKLDDKYKTVKVLTAKNGLVKGKKYVVEATKTFDDKIDTKEWEPIKEYKLDGKWINARYCVGVCPDCGGDADNTWHSWWGYKSKEKMDAIVSRQGSWVYLVIQMFAFEWAAVYATYFKYNNKKSVKGAKEFLIDLGPTMNSVMESD
tara:strand:+ start:35 stop:1162 length:1128 start_codon:yes stop_codon:yes gene_type:complete